MGGAARCPDGEVLLIRIDVVGLFMDSGMLSDACAIVMETKKIA
jgi:hypothetical protein